MAQETPKSYGWGLWNIVESVTATVKQKSDEIINIYKEDLQEFSRTIVNDTSAVIKEEVAKLSALNIGKEDERKVKKNAPRPNPREARLLRIQRDPKTYTEAPQDEGYEAWATSFNVGTPENTEAITHLLTSNETVREFHTSLVPAKVSYRDFWCWYYFRVHKLEEEEKRRADILNNASFNDEEEEFNWDVDDDSSTKPVAPSSPAPSTPSSISSSAPSSVPTSPSLSTPTSTSEISSPVPPSTPPPTPASDSDSMVVDKSIPVAEVVPTDTTPTSSPSKAEIPEFTSSDESFEDDIEAEIAKKYETQKQEETPTTPTAKTEAKSDAEDGWADWE